MDTFSFSGFGAVQGEGPLSAQIPQYDFTNMPAGLSPFQNLSNLFTPNPNVNNMNGIVGETQTQETAVVIGDNTNNSSNNSSANSGQGRVPRMFTFDLKDRDASKSTTASPAVVPVGGTKPIDKSTSSVA